MARDAGEGSQRGASAVPNRQGWCQEFFRRGADSSDEGAKIWFLGYYKCQKSPKKRFSPSDGGLACSDGEGYSPLALPWRHPCKEVPMQVGGLLLLLAPLPRYRSGVPKSGL